MPEFHGKGSSKKREEEIMKTGCLGPQGSYSEQAAKHLSPDSEIVLYKNFPAVIRSIETGETDEIVLPIENTIQGGVLQNMDLLAERSDLFIVKEYVMPVNHRLVMKEGGTVSEIKRVFSHPQAIGQCSVFLSERLPSAQKVPAESTAQSLSMVKEKTDACIVGEHLCRNLQGFTVYPEEIADEKKNFTYFELIKKGKKYIEGKPSKLIYFVAKLSHTAGSLYALLGILNAYKLNMTKIESRPIKDKPGEYRFFIEIEGDYSSPVISQALQQIEGACLEFKLLGCY
jgi:prephenate dehydratase